jgi:hypothetical protein
VGCRPHLPRHLFFPGHAILSNTSPGPRGPTGLGPPLGTQGGRGGKDGFSDGSFPLPRSIPFLIAGAACRCARRCHRGEPLLRSKDHGDATGVLRFRNTRNSAAAFAAAPDASTRARRLLAGVPGILRDKRATEGRAGEGEGTSSACAGSETGAPTPTGTSTRATVRDNCVSFGCLQLE